MPMEQIISSLNLSPYHLIEIIVVYVVWRIRGKIMEAEFKLDSLERTLSAHCSEDASAVSRLQASLEAQAKASEASQRRIHERLDTISHDLGVVKGRLED